MCRSRLNTKPGLTTTIHYYINTDIKHFESTTSECFISTNDVFCTRSKHLLALNYFYFECGHIEQKQRYFSHLSRFTISCRGTRAFNLITTSRKQPCNHNISRNTDLLIFYLSVNMNLTVSFHIRPPPHEQTSIQNTQTQTNMCKYLHGFCRFYIILSGMRNNLKVNHDLQLQANQEPGPTAHLDNLNISNEQLSRINSILVAFY